MKHKVLTPDYLFEVSWEICNKVGGINTVIATKSLKLQEQFKDRLIFIGPDVWREPEKNPAFEEDKDLFKTWRRQAKTEGLRIRTGRWNIIGNPIVILVDFSSFVPQKNQIFSNFWESYHLDSLSGSHDYVEAAMFGYAAGKVIEHFWDFNLSIREKTIAHFHEWMTGAGVLYLKKAAPQIATVFTTHATTVGRSLAGHGFPLYKQMHEYNGDQKAKELGIVAKQSMEKISANQADCFTTVSEITATECKQFLEKEVDEITPNGFEDSFVPKGNEFNTKREKARNKLLEVAEAVVGHEIKKDALLICNSGRYEFYNKGIDIFIHSMCKLQNEERLQKEVVAFVLVPANNYGARKELQEKLSSSDASLNISKSFLTHGLHDSEYDPILNEIKSCNFTNDKNQKVKIIFVPSYLNGRDGIFNMKYYELLIGFDLTIFPSYYEPWGYTPLESLAFHVPTITTNLAGIGMWVNRELVEVNNGIDIFERGVGKDQSLIDKIVNRCVTFSIRNQVEINQARNNAYEISRIALWENLLKHYYKAYSIALKKLDERKNEIADIAHKEQITPQKRYKTNKPIWKGLHIEAKLPEMFAKLDELSKNLWWSWNDEAIELFQYIDPELWDKGDRNPILLLKAVPHERYLELEEDEAFILKYTNVIKKLKKYLEEPMRTDVPKVAYFSMEYGISDTVKIFSGGLGILAGDYLKEASDSCINMIGVGFLYRYGYFTQQLSIKGEQLVSYEPQNFSNLPASLAKDKNGEVVTVQVAFPGRVVYARVWKLNVGRIKLYLLDTDFEKNNKEDRKISHQLYGGDNEHRLKQEMLLGVGGIRALETLEIEQDVYHCNEGHAAFIGIERMRKFIVDMNYTFDEALEIVRASSLFTTHTPVPAGHDSFEKDLIMVYMGHYPERLKTTWERFISLGRWNPENMDEKFSMSVLAANLCQEVNGVSYLHGEVTKDMFAKLWEGYYPEELHVGYVTNGVHLPSWLAKPWKQLYNKEFGKRFIKDQSNKDLWKNIYKVDDARIWEIREQKRTELINQIKHRLSSNWISRHVDPKKIVAVRNKVNEHVLTIGFARRFATYKRAHLLFKDIDRLEKIVNNPERPVQFIFAGKAHPADGGGQGLIKHIVEISNRPEFLGKVIFLQNYDIQLAKKLVQGVDVWLNTPTRPLEASGTSGMKAVMNGVLNFSVLDGWWVEGYKENAGWALPMERSYSNQAFQDDLDAETIYTLLEQEILPLFYDRDENNIPTAWIQYIKKNIAEIAPDFTTKRMIDDYCNRFYKKLYKRTVELRSDDYATAKAISYWKKKVARSWESIQLVSMDLPESTKTQLISGEKYKGEVVLDLNELSNIDVGVEIVITDNEIGSKVSILENLEMKLTKKEGTKAYYEVEIAPAKPGVFNYGVRVFPKNEYLPHRQDFSYVKWI